MPVWIPLVAIYLIWGTTYLAMRIAVSALPPWGMAGLRYLVVGALCLLAARLRGRPWPSAAAWLRAVPVGFLFFVVGNGLIAVAEQTIASSVAAVVAASTPLFAAAINATRGERPTRGELLGMTLGMLGVVLLAGSSAILDAGLRGVLLLVAPLGFAAGSILVRSQPVTVDGHRPAGPLEAVAPAMLTAGVTMLGLSALTREHLPATVPAAAILAWLYLVIAGTLIAFTAYAWLLRHARPATAMSHAYVNPLVAVLLGAVLGGERPGFTSVLAGAAIAGGVLLAVSLRERPTTPPARTGGGAAPREATS